MIDACAMVRGAYLHVTLRFQLAGQLIVLHVGERGFFTFFSSTTIKKVRMNIIMGDMLRICEAKCVPCDRHHIQLWNRWT